MGPWVFPLSPLAAAVLQLATRTRASRVNQERAPTTSRSTLVSVGAAMLTGVTFAPCSLSAQVLAESMPEVVVNGERNDGYNSGVSSIGGGIPTPIRDIPQSVTVINSELMQAQGATSLADALRNVPGITMGAAEGGSIGNNFNLRGFSARTDLYLDGMRDRGQYYRDVFSLDSGRSSSGSIVDALWSWFDRRGHQSGQQAADLDARSAPPRWLAELSLPHVPPVDFNQPIDDASAFRIAAMGQNVHSTRDVMHNEDYGAAPSLRFGIGTPTQITLSALLMHNNDMPDYGLPPVNAQPAQVIERISTARPTTARSRTWPASTRRSAISSRNVTLRNQTQYSRYTIDARESGPNNVGTLNQLWACIPHFLQRISGTSRRCRSGHCTSASAATTATSPTHRSTTRPT